MKILITQIFFHVLFLIFCGSVSFAQLNQDSIKVRADSAQHLDTSIQPKNYTATLDSFLKKNKYLNITAAPVSLAVKEKQRIGKETLFYVLAITTLLLAIFKVFYSKYFNNIFRVFFNTSLRQNQLTDLLLQAKLPSLIFNLFFIISLGLYLWLLIGHYGQEQDNYFFAGLSILFIALVYFGKFVSLKLIGWACGMSEVADQYIFVIFLINKITGILLIPFIILLAFAPAVWLNVVSISSFCILGILLIMRYLRSYGLLQSRLKFNPFHFLIYLAAVEFLPFLIIYKVFTDHVISK
jgi:hypothetical protein